MYFKGIINLRDKNDNEYKDAEKTLESYFDLRKFEINLFWEINKYFVAFLSAILAGYFAFEGKGFVVEYVLLGFGVIFSFIFYLVNRGLRFNLKNFETNIDLLNSNKGGVYRSVTFTKKDKKFWNILGTYPISYYKANSFISIIMFLSFCLLFIKEIAQYYIILGRNFEGIKSLFPACASLLVIISLVSCFICLKSDKFVLIDKKIKQEDENNFYIYNEITGKLYKSTTADKDVFDEIK